ncbi:hypothetical protein [Erythrobacter sp.]|uniref:hypothetical protein n=1 Tax=Erythrobacter sp. TaxID=1042 RepID=UPI00342D4E1E
MRLDLAALHGGHHRLVGRPDLVEVAVLQIEQIVPVMHVEHRIARVGRVVTGRQPDRETLVGQALGSDALVLDQASSILGGKRHGEADQCGERGKQS